jgi:serine/threonine protein kinase
LLAELARGGMGIVHLAEARGPGGFEKLVVVKELKAELTDDPVYCAMFLDEARLAARLSHRHIVQTNEVGCERGRYFMALELLEGGSLHQIRTKLGLRALPSLVSVRILVAVLDALDHAHELTDAEGASLGVVHRDVSPQNVFLTFDGGVKLIDFGVAKSKDRRGAAITRVGVVKGSVPFMSPDHVDGSAESASGATRTTSPSCARSSPATCRRSRRPRLPPTRCPPRSVRSSSARWRLIAPIATRPPRPCAMRSRAISPSTIRAALWTTSARGSSAISSRSASPSAPS